MGNRVSAASSGFTIIETVLFLAVTGALIAGIIFATSSSIGTQRYRDATESFKALLQQQYADVRNVQNPRSSSWSCNDQATVTSGTVLAGQSDCVMVGKYMIIDNTDIATYRVIASKIAGVPDDGNDITVLRTAYRLNLDKSDVQQHKLEWGARIAWATAGDPDDVKAPTTPRAIALLFVRSPVSGQTYTFSTNTVPNAAQLAGATTAQTFLRAMIQPGVVVPGQQGRTICLVPAAMTTVASNALYVAPYASGSSSIEVRSNDVAAGLGVAERC
jgi:type II secretory pathway pseudopilin PulG